MTEEDIIEKSNQDSLFCNTEMSHEVEQMQKSPTHASYPVRYLLQWTQQMLFR